MVRVNRRLFSEKNTQPLSNFVQNRKKIIKSKHCMVKNCVIFLCHHLFLKRWLCSVTSSKYQCRLLLVLANLNNVIIIKIKSIITVYTDTTYHNYCNVDQSFLSWKIQPSSSISVKSHLLPLTEYLWKRFSKSHHNSKLLDTFIKSIIYFSEYY